MNALESTIDNLINGNLTDAKKQAKRHSYRMLRETYQAATGSSAEVACAAVDYLKGMATFQEYCDAKAKEAGK